MADRNMYPLDFYANAVPNTGEIQWKKYLDMRQRHFELETQALNDFYYAIAGKVHPKTKPNKKKRRRKPGQPKRPPSAYNLFIKEFSESEEKKRIDQTRDSTNNETWMKIGSQKWNELSQLQKEPYQARAQFEKEMYDKRMLEFRSGDAYSVEDFNEDGTVNRRHKRRRNNDSSTSNEVVASFPL